MCYQVIYDIVLIFVCHECITNVNSQMLFARCNLKMFQLIIHVQCENTLDEAFVVFEQFQSCSALRFYTIFNCVEILRVNVKYLNVYDS